MSTPNPTHIDAPSACKWCQREEREHTIEWAEAIGYHNWVEPTVDQRRERMLARRHNSAAAAEGENR